MTFYLQYPETTYHATKLRITRPLRSASEGESEELPTRVFRVRRRRGSRARACGMPRVSLGGSTAPDGSPRTRITAANAFAAASEDGNVSDRDAMTPPTASLPNQDAWREQSSDSDSEYEVEAYEGPPGPTSSRPSLKDATLNATRARKPDAFDRVAGGVGTLARGFGPRRSSAPSWLGTCFCSIPRTTRAPPPRTKTTTRATVCTARSIALGSDRGTRRGMTCGSPCAPPKPRRRMRCGRRSASRRAPRARCRPSPRARRGGDARRCAKA